MHILDAFKSDPQRFDGVRPFNIWGLRLFFFVMVILLFRD
jgi:hypothetical protein